MCSTDLKFLLCLIAFLSLLPLLIALLRLGPVVSVAHACALHLVDEGDHLARRLILGSPLNKPDHRSQLSIVSR
jgi:hypothetical protein